MTGPILVQNQRCKEPVNALVARLQVQISRSPSIGPHTGLDAFPQPTLLLPLLIRILRPLISLLILRSTDRLCAVSCMA
jgi:hypothetical protein